ncbi:MAG TPA: PLP-dependent aminotransferase family protein [Gammaproteobacteria bacterium]|jgi:DNA-binding transcriptional MocR family regulator|nr:PLP-dependent aminotransferase family protein [Gammaproteobacteria bacterium]
MEQHKYNQIAEQLQQQIRSRVYKAGDKLPSVRSLAKQRQVSISTILSAYALLEDRNLIEVRPKSGYYVKRVLTEKPLLPSIDQRFSPPEVISTPQLVMEIMDDSPEPGVISFGSAIPASDFPVTNQLRKIFAQKVRSEPFLGIGYGAGKGYEPLRQQLARRAVDAGVMVSPDEILVTDGCQAGVGLCLRALTKPGDIVAMETPSYYGVLQLIEALGLKLIEIPSNPETGMSIDALRLALEQWPVKAVLTIPCFNNPVGSLMPDAHKQALVDLVGHYDIPLIEDDIYGDLGYSDQRPRAAKSFDTSGRVILCSSVSKALEPQLGIGWIMPGKYLEAIEYEKYLNSTGIFRLPQMAVAEILARGAYDRHLRLARDAYRQRRDRLIDLISQHFPAGTRMTAPQGGFVAWVQLPGDLSAKRIYQRAKQKHILIAPGEIFSSNPERYASAIRLTYSARWTSRREEAIQTLGEIIKDS